MSDLIKKEQQAIKLLRSFANSATGVVELAYSGGKDSDVILHLSRLADINITPIYKNTTIDPPLTKKHALQNKVGIINPKLSFFDIVRKKGFPDRHRRFCCEILKEYNTNKYVILGIRKDESTKRAKLYKEPIQCYTDKKIGPVQRCTPILFWSNEDVAEYITQNKIKCHPLYYDEKGCFHVERRLGCMGCPLQSQKGRVKTFLDNPKLLKAWIRAGKEYYKNKVYKGNIKVDVYSKLYTALFLNSVYEYDSINNGLFGNIDCKKLLEDYFKIDLTIK